MADDYWPSSSSELGTSRLKHAALGLFLIALLGTFLIFLVFKVGALNLTPQPSVNLTSPKASTLPAVSAPPLTQDADADGFPDAAQLYDPQDCLRFRRWFCAIAEAQYYRLSPAWDSSQRDCAGLLRYAYKEALRKHDLSWVRTANLKGLAPLPDVAAFNYPQVPLLGEKLFRVRPGSLNSHEFPFAAFADAESLKNFNLTYLGKDRQSAQEGDILIFYRPRNPDMPYHMMVYLQSRKFAHEERGEWLVYHTGPDLWPTKSPGEVRLVSWEELQKHPDPAWHPAAGNPHYLGFYRWRILKG